MTDLSIVSEPGDVVARIADEAAADAVRRLTGDPAARSWMSPSFRAEPPAPRGSTQGAQIAEPDYQGFAAIVRAYDDRHPISHAAVRSDAVDHVWVAGQLRRRRTFLLSVARSFGLGTAALEAMDDRLDEQLAELEKLVRPELAKALAL